MQPSKRRSIARVADWVTWHRRAPAFERHIRRSEPLLAHLRSRGHDNPNVLAILLVESFYRPRVVRAAEYVFWAVACALGMSVERLSVGRAQLQLRHWRARGMLDETTFSRASLARVRDPEANYVACRRFLERGGMLTRQEDAELARFYTGASRRYTDLIHVARGAVGTASG